MFGTDFIWLTTHCLSFVSWMYHRWYSRAQFKCPVKIFTCPVKVRLSLVKLMCTAGKRGMCPPFNITCPFGHITTQLNVPMDKIYTLWPWRYYALMSSSAYCSTMIKAEHKSTGGHLSKRCCLFIKGIPIIKIRWCHDRLIFIMEITIPGKTIFILRWGQNSNS